MRSLYSNKNYMRYLYDNKSKPYPYTILLVLLLVGCYILQVLDVIPIEYVVMNTQEVFDLNIFGAFISLFFHANTIHFVLNLVALFLFSKKAEEELGIATPILFILGGALANVVAAFYAGFFSEHYLSVGASAGIAPLIFLTLLTRPFTYLTPFAYFIILFDIFNLSNQNTNVNHAVHVIGYLTSFILIAFISFKNKKMIYLSILFNLGMLIALFFITQEFGNEIIDYILNLIG